METNREAQDRPWAWAGPGPAGATGGASWQEGPAQTLGGELARPRAQEELACGGRGSWAEGRDAALRRRCCYAEARNAGQPLPRQKMIGFFTERHQVVITISLKNENINVQRALINITHCYTTSNQCAEKDIIHVVVSCDFCLYRARGGWPAGPRGQSSQRQPLASHNALPGAASLTPPPRSASLTSNPQFPLRPHCMHHALQRVTLGMRVSTRCCHNYVVIQNLGFHS